MTDILNPNETNTLPVNNLPPLPPLPTQPIIPPQAYSGSPIANSNPSKKNIKPFIIIGVILLLLIIGFLIFNSLVGNKKSTKSISTTKNSTTSTKNSSNGKNMTPTPIKNNDETFYKYRFGKTCDYNETKRAINFSVVLEKISDDYYYASYSINLSGKELSKIKGKDGSDLIKKDANGDFVGVYNSEIKLKFSIIDKKLVTVKIAEKDDPIIENCLKSINYELPFITFSSYVYPERNKSFFKEGKYTTTDGDNKLEIINRSQVGFGATITNIATGKQCSSYLTTQNYERAFSINSSFVNLNQGGDYGYIYANSGISSFEEKCGIKLFSKDFKSDN